MLGALTCLSGAIRAILLDISKAFDKVWLVGSLHKLKSYEISGQIFGLNASFLGNWWLPVVLDGNYFQEYSIDAGTPEGPMLCSTLNSIKLRVFFGENIGQNHLCHLDRNFCYFFKSNIPVINLILGSRNMIKLSKKYAFVKKNAKKLSVFGENESRRLSNFLQTHIFWNFNHISRICNQIDYRNIWFPKVIIILIMTTQVLFFNVFFSGKDRQLNAVEHFSNYTLMTFLMMLSVILLSMLMKLLSTINLISHLVCGNN